MLRIAILLAVVAALSGCAGLRVEWDFSATYNKPAK